MITDGDGWTEKILQLGLGEGISSFRIEPLNKSMSHSVISCSKINANALRLLGLSYKKYYTLFFFLDNPLNEGIESFGMMMKV